MISPAYAAWLCNAIYSPVTPDVFSDVQNFDAVTVGVSMANGMTCITFAGSESGLDWLRDFEAVPFAHPQLGTIHEGFWQGMEAAFGCVRYLLKTSGPIAIQGHSLGCAHASILAGLCAVNGIPVDQLTLFAPPRVGYIRFVELVQAHVKKVLPVRNGIDPVPGVPVELPDMPWRQFDGMVRVKQWPKWYLAWDPARWHSIGLYLKAAPTNI